jgi:E3 ubiquitin-protein ligase TRIP12
MRQECLLSILKWIYSSSAAVLTEVLYNLRISSFIAGLLASRVIETVLIGCYLSKILLEKLPNIFCIYFRREGVVKEFEFLLGSDNNQIFIKGERSSLPNQEESHQDNPSAPKFPIELSGMKILGVEEANCWNHMIDTITALYQIYFNHEENDAAVKDMAKGVIQDLKTISDTLKGNNLSEKEATDALNKLASYFQSNIYTTVSTFELFQSGIIQSLSNFLFDDLRSLNATQRLLLFMQVFMGYEAYSTSSPSNQEYPMVHFISRLHDMLFKIDRTPIYVREMKEPTHNSNYNSNIVALRLLMQPLKLRFKREEGNDEDLRDYSENVVSIDPIVSLGHIEECLRTRVLSKSGKPKPDYSESISSNHNNSGSSRSPAVTVGGTHSSSTDEDTSRPESFESLTSDLNVDTLIKCTYERYLRAKNSPATQRDGGPHQLELYYNGKLLPYDVSVFQVISQHATELPSGSDQNSIRFSWSSIYTLTYRKKTLAASIQNPIAMSEKTPQPPTLDYLTLEMCMASCKDIEILYGKIFLDRFGKLPILTREQPRDRESFIDIIRLLRFLSMLNSQWPSLMNHIAQSNFIRLPTLSPTIFLDGRLSSKLQRQLQDLLVVTTGGIPRVWFELVEQVPMLFHLKVRRDLLIVSSFGLGRILTQLFPDSLVMSDSNPDDAPRLGRLKRQKIEIRRDQILASAIQILDRHASNKAFLEIQYVDEVGTGLGPTQEFFTLVSQEFQRKQRRLFHESCYSGTNSDYEGEEEFIYSLTGLYPRPLNTTAVVTSQQDTMKMNMYIYQVQMFHVLGQFLAKALMDSRLVGIQLNTTFWKLVFEGREGVIFQDLENIDPSMYRILCDLRTVVLEKKRIYNDSDHMSQAQIEEALQKLTLKGVKIEDLCLNFTLPGYPEIELKTDGSDIPITVYNLDEYIQLVAEHMLWISIAPCVESFKEGFTSVFPIHHLRIFSFEELNLLLCGIHEPWNPQSN